MGFFVAGNFYPDYILWIDTPEKQYITFVDPKGLLRIMPDDPKIEFYKTIKDLEKQLAPTAGRLFSVHLLCLQQNQQICMNGGIGIKPQERHTMSILLMMTNVLSV